MNSRNSIRRRRLVCRAAATLGQHVEGRKQSGGAMAQVFMAEAGDGPSIGQSEIALGAFQHLDMRLFVYRQDHRALWGIEVQAHDVGRLRGELGIGADAPTAPSLQ